MDGEPTAARKGAKPATRVVDASGRHLRPTRSSKLPEPLEKPPGFDFACERTGDGEISVVQHLRELEATDAFRTKMLPCIDAAERRRLAPRPGEKSKRNRPGAYTILDLWRIETAQRAAAHLTHRETSNWLSSDEAMEFRREFGFDQEREGRAGGKPQLKTTKGIPSAFVRCRYRNEWFPEKKRAAAWKCFQRALTYEKLAVDPEGMAKEAELLFADGTIKETHHLCTKMKNKKVEPQYRLNRETGELIDAVTCPEGGFIPPTAGQHSGNGFNIVATMTPGGTIPSWRVEALNEDEPASLLKQTSELGRFLRAAQPERLTVLSTDAGFNNAELREELHKVRIVENIHIASHGKSDTNKKSVAAKDEQVIAIEGYPNWYADGHRKLHCKCGHAKFVRRTGEKSGGEVSVRVEGTCSGPDRQGGCGSITITAGQWRLADNKQKFVLAAEGDERSWTFGNFLTFHDPLAKRYGKPRFNIQEGYFGSQLERRFNTTTKRWIRRKTQAEIDVAISFALLDATSLAFKRERLRQEPPVSPVPSNSALAVAA